MFAKQIKELKNTLYYIRFPMWIRVNLQNDARIPESTKIVDSNWLYFNNYTPLPLSHPPYKH